MTLWNPEYRIKIDNEIVTNMTLSGLTINSGRTDIYSQPVAGYCNLTLLETSLSNVGYEINDGISIEVKDSNGDFVFLFGGFITDINISIASSGSTALVQYINIVAVGALARLVRTTFSGNIASDFDGDQIYSILSTVLFNRWNDLSAALSWNTYDSTVTWTNAENSGLGEIDRPGDYELDNQNGLLDTVYNVVSALAVSGLGYIYEDSQGRIGYADSTHRSEYYSANGYVNLDGNHAIGPGLNISKKSADVRNAITLTYGGTGSLSVEDSDLDSIELFGELSANVSTTIKHQADAEDQAAFYLSIRAYPQYEMTQITFEIDSPEIDDGDRDSLINVFMGLPLNITNLPSNMINGQFQGFVEGWTWRAGYNRLTLTLNISPLAYTLQSFRWNSVSVAESWNTLSNTLNWLDATIVA